MRIAVAGSGSIGRRHISNLQELVPNLSFALIRKDSRKDHYSNSIGAQVFPDLESAISPSLDALLIATPSDLHAELICQGLKFGLPMYVEKPVVTSESQVSLLRSQPSFGFASPFTQVGCNLRFLPSLILLRDLLASGAIGRVVRASFQAGQWLPDWRPCQNYRQSYSSDSRRGGGVLLDLIHEIDTARWLLGELTPLACSVSQVASLEISSEGVAIAQLRSTHGVLVQIGLDYVARRPLRRYQIVGDAGTLIWDLPRQILLLETASAQKLIECTESCFDVSATYRTAMQAFLAGLRGVAQPMQPLNEGLACAELAITLKEMACQSL